MHKNFWSPDWRGRRHGPFRRHDLRRRNWGLRAAMSAAIFLAVLVLLGAGVGGSIFLWYFSRGLPGPGQIIQRSVAQSTKIYDRTGKNLLFDVHGDIKRTTIVLADIPPHVKAAAIVAEDKNFYKHGGFDLRGILRALIANVSSGGRVQGGSTITQQFIKNAVLSPEKTYSRKFKELVMAYKLEKDFSKDQILEMYFNEIPYGSTSYGVEAAANAFFGKSANELDLAEAALLAALPKAPTYYSPYGSHSDELLGRWKYILNLMAEEKHVDGDDAKRAATVDILKRIKPRREKIVAPHFVMYVRELLAEKYGDSAVESGGLRVITTLDLETQGAAEAALTSNKRLINSFGASNAAIVAIDVKTGHVAAMVGSLDYFNEKIDGQVNVVVRPRQPGSSFKPIVYAASFLSGYTPNTVLYDVNTVFKTEIGKDYEPKNYDGKERGPLTARQALALSLNIPAVKMLYLTGVGNVLDLAENMGYSTFSDRSRFGLSLVLGGGEVNLLEHASAFSVFARDGAYLPPRAILRVEGAARGVTEDWQAASPKNVFDVEVARMISSILSDNEARAPIFGRENYLTLGERPIAAKTGTTNDFRDAWAVGYTPSLVAGVWVGNNDNSQMKNAADGSAVAAPIWNSFMRSVLVRKEMEAFVAPQEATTGKPILDGVVNAGVKVKIDKMSGKLATANTPSHLVEEKSYRQTHDILYFIDKNDPRGRAPDDPSADPQFANWEAAAKRWATERDFIDESPPSEYDNLHLVEDKPILKIVSPSDGETVGSLRYGVSVETSSRRGVRRVEIYIDNQPVGALSGAPWSQEVLTPAGLPNGFHVLRAVAFDDLENNYSAEISFNLLR